MATMRKKMTKVHSTDSQTGANNAADLCWCLWLRPCMVRCCCSSYQISFTGLMPSEVVVVYLRASAAVAVPSASWSVLAAGFKHLAGSDSIREWVVNRMIDVNSWLNSYDDGGCWCGPTTCRFILFDSRWASQGTFPGRGCWLLSKIW